MIEWPASGDVAKWLDLYKAECEKSAALLHRAEAAEARLEKIAKLLGEVEGTGHYFGVIALALAKAREVGTP